jgi:NitT/TauT family transport system substrate-binding protein
MVLSRRAALAVPLLAASARLASAQAPVTARIGVIPILAAAPVFVADREGWLKDGGLATRYTTFESGPNMIQALASGTIDVYVAGVAPLAVARTRGIDIKVVASTAVEEMTVVVTPKLARFFEPGVAPAEAFKRYRAATGSPARLATQPAGSVPNATLQHWLWEVTKTDRADATIIAMGIDATQQAILVGAVEGGTVREPAVTIVTQRDPGIKVVALGGMMFPDQPGTVIAVTAAFLRDHRDKVQAIVNGAVRAVQLIGTDPARAAVHVEQALGKGIVDGATIGRALVSPSSKFTADPRRIIEATAALQRYQVKIGALEREAPLHGLFDTSFYTRAIAS